MTILDPVSTRRMKFLAGAFISMIALIIFFTNGGTPPSGGYTNTTRPPGGGASYPTKYFGFYAAGNKEAWNGDPVADTAGFSNLLYIHAKTDPNWYLQMLQRAQQYNMKVVLNVDFVFFDTVGQTYKLYPQATYQQKWASFQSLIAPYLSRVVAFYIIDEPYIKAETKAHVSQEKMRGWVSTAAAVVKASYPSIATATVFDYLHSFAMPDNIDWVGFDCYNGFTHCPADNPNSPSINQYLATLKSKMKPGQRIMLFPTAASETNASPAMTQDRVVNMAGKYFALMQSEPLVIAVLPFLWQGLSGQDPWVGARDLPQVRDAYTNFGYYILNAGSPL